MFNEETDYTPLFNRALEEPYGLYIETNNPQRMQVVLCEFAKNKFQYDVLMVCVPSRPSEVWLVQKGVTMP